MKRFMSLLLTVVMVLGMLPAMSLTASAASVDSWDELRAALEADDDAVITVTKDIKGESKKDLEDEIGTGSSPFDTVVVKGNKTLDLNGNEVYYKDKNGFYVWSSQDEINIENRSVMFRIPEGASLTVKDSKGDGKIQFDSQMVKAQPLELACYCYYVGVSRRDVFDVSGKLTINGGIIEAGSTHRQWIVNGEEIESENVGADGIAKAKIAVDSDGYYFISGGDGRFDGYARHMIWGSAVSVKSGGVLSVNSGELIGRGSGLYNESYYRQRQKETLPFVFSRDELIEVEEGATVHINGGKFTANGGANIFGGNADKADVNVDCGEFRVDKHDHVRSLTTKSYRKAGGWEESYCTQIALEGTYGAINLPSGSVNSRADKYDSATDKVNGKSVETMAAYRSKESTERKNSSGSTALPEYLKYEYRNTGTYSSAQWVTWDGVSDLVLIAPSDLKHYFTDRDDMRSAGYKYSYEWCIYTGHDDHNGTVNKKLEKCFIFNLSDKEPTDQYTLNLNALPNGEKIDWSKTDQWTVQFRTVEKAPDDTIIIRAIPSKVNLRPALAFKDQSPAMTKGSTTAWLKTTVGQSYTYSFDNEECPDGYTVEKSARMEALIPDATITPITATEKNDRPINIAYTFQKAGWYTLTQTMRLKNSAGDTTSSLTHTFHIYASDIPPVTPEITLQPESVHSCKAGTSVTLSAQAKDAASARWQRISKDGTVTYLDAVFNAATGKATLTTTAGGVSNGAKFYCEFRSEDDVVTLTEAAIICCAPTVTNGTAVTVAPGGRAYLNVTATGCEHYASDNGWYKNGQKLTNGSKYYAMGTTLAVENVTAADAGTYTYKYVTTHGDTATGTAELKVAEPVDTTYINTFEIYMDDVVFGKKAPLIAQVPGGVGYRVKSVEWTAGVNADQIITASSAVAKITLAKNGTKQFKGNSEGDLVGTLNGITARIYGVTTPQDEITVTITFGGYGTSFKVEMPESDAVSVTTEKLTFSKGKAYTAADGMKLAGTFTCDHDDLASAYHHTGMSYTVESTSGSKMPEGLTLNRDGSITGTPTAEGIYTVVILAHSANAALTPSDGSGFAVKTVTLEVVDDHEHSFVKQSTTATCEQDGTATYACACGEKSTAHEPKLGHDWEEWTVLTAATCTESGEQKRVCKRDSSHAETTIVPAAGHTESAAWKSDETHHWKTCTVAACGEQITDTRAAHQYGEDNSCDICGHIKQAEDDEPLPSFSVSIASSENGIVQTESAAAEPGSTVKLVVIPEAGYKLGSLVIKSDGVSFTPEKNGTYDFIMPYGDVTVEAIFVKTLPIPDCPRDITCPMYDFKDLVMNNWYHDGIHFCVDRGLMNGTGTTTFAPNMTTSRAMIVTILWRLEGSPIVSYDMDFSDVAAGSWYTDAVRWAASKGIVEGYGNGKFGTNDPITREQMATIMYRYAKYKGYDVSAATDLNAYGDAANVNSWAVEAMQWACGVGLIQGVVSGSVTNLAPTGSATRSQAATILYRFCDAYVHN